MSSQIFALVIGIDSYKSGSIWNLHSCVDDARRIRRWLLDDLNVPRDHVCLLLDNQATKDGIETAFMDHLVNNPVIQQDDAILIYFAGHGSNITAPRDWFHGLRKFKSVEVLCSYDYDMKQTHGRVSGISDRSLHAMIDELASAKGDNITLFLDTCFSPIQSPQNIRERSRTRWTAPTKLSSEDLFRGLWPGARGKVHNTQFGFLEPNRSTHILVAACASGQIAVEGKDGGRFTTALLDALSKLTLHRTSYAHLLDYLNINAAEGQQAVCFGKRKNRVIFNDIPFVADPAFLSVALGVNRELRVEAGAIHGVVEGSELSLHIHNYSCSRNPPFASAIISQVHPSWSFARLTSQEPAVPKSCWGQVTRWNNRPPFRVKLKASLTGFLRLWKVQKALQTSRHRSPTAPPFHEPREAVAKFGSYGTLQTRHKLDEKSRQQSYQRSWHPNSLRKESNIYSDPAK